ALSLAEIFYLGGFARDAGLEDRVHHEIRIGIRRYGADFHAHALFIADGDANHRAAVDRGRFNLIGSLKVRIQAAVGIYAGVEEQTNVVAVRQDTIDESPAKFAKF